MKIADDFVGMCMTGVVICAAIIISVFSDHQLNLPYLFVGPVIMLITWIFSRGKDENGILASFGFIVALFVTYLAI